jgi:two-component system, cell cycle sensor histidine kinase and response regulator CckA
VLDRVDPGPTTATPSRAEDELFLHHPVPLWVFDRVTLRFLAVNDAALAQYGYSRDELLAMTVLDICQDLTDHRPAAPDGTSAGATWHHSGVCRLRTKDGRILHAETTANDLTFNGIAAVAAAAYDVTNRIAAETATLDAQRQLRAAHDRLRDSESRYRDLVENLDDVVFSLDPLGTIEYVSSAVASYGYTPADLIGKPFQTIVHPDDVGPITASFGQTLAGSTRKGEYRMFDKAGQLRYIRTSSRVQVRDGRPVSVSGVLIDNTEQRRTQEQLKAAGRLEAVGRLAGGVAHDFNNLLVAINGFAELALSEAPEGSGLHADLSEIIKAGHRAAALTAQLLAFSRRQVLHPDSVCLNDVAMSMEPMLRRLIGEDVNLVIECEPNLPHVRIDTGHLEQVVMNLVVNARDAMPDGGTLRVATSSRDFPKHELPDGLSPASIAVLAVSDTGEGMDEATQAQIFEPFFTTKPLGQGTGLGLAMVYGFVKQSGGAINVRSAPGAGATFRIALPQAASGSAEVSTLAPVVENGSETVLVTEDETTVRTLVRRVLERAGYHVLTAESADEALRICRGFEGRIDLLLTDVVMPQMSGTMLAQRTAAIRPGMRVLFMSGYSGREPGVAASSDPFLQKPFNAVALSEAVRSALARPARRIALAQSSDRDAM